MAESFETPKPPPPVKPGAILPRISYADKSAQSQPDGDDTAPPAPSLKKEKKDKKEGGKPSKLEETPRFDTYETRRTIRIVAGSAIGGVIFLVACVVYWTFNGSDQGAGLPDEGSVAQGTVVDPAKREAEARQMYHQAQLAAENGNGKLAISLLDKLIRSYPNSAAVKDAQDALDRSKQGLPLFPQGPAVVAKAADQAVEAPAEPPPVVEAVEAGPTAPVKADVKSDVQIVLPPSPPEPRRPGTALTAAEVPARTLPAGFHARTEAGVHASGWPLEIVGDRDGATMVLVPSDTFIVGLDDGTPAEGPSHQVTLATFYIDQHEVTARQYNRFMKETGRRVEGKNASASDPSTPDPAENHPVVRVSATEARAYAKWAGKSLPTEAQWEAAARTPDGRIHPWGSSSPPWDKPRAAKQIDPVMSFPGDLSPYGVYDLAGNAWEWTADWYDPKYHEPFKNSVSHDPIGPARSRTKPPQVTIKGGSPNWQSSWRQGMKADAHLAFLGFRCALTVEQPTGPVQAEGQPAPARPSTPPTNDGVVPF